MLFVYPAVFHKEDDACWVDFPDLEGCQSFGGDIDETMKGAQEALAAYLLTMLEEGSPFARPSDISAITAEGSGSFTSLVACDINQYKDAKSVKKTLTIPSWLNERAVSLGVNFSQVLQEALLQKIRA